MPEKINLSGVIHTGISDQPWEQIVLQSDTDSMWTLWKELFLEVLDKHVPIQHIRKKSSSIPWLTSEIKKLLFDRDKKKCRAMIIKLNANWDEYKASRNKVNIALRQAKADYYRNKIATQNNNPKEAWKTINRLLGRSFSDTSVNELKINDLVPYSKVLNLLNSLSKSKETGLDKISGKILKAAASFIASSLTYIFNHALISSHFPSEWKVARLLPLFKKGPRNLAENYSPISILPSISKLMERIMYDLLYEYLNENYLLSDHQFGVPLLYGITGNALSMNKSFLTDRKQKCQLGDVITSESRVTCGIPQGFILGSLLFLLYINDQPDCLRQVSPRLFADDTNLTAAGETIEEVELAMNNDLLRIKEWPLANKLSLNVAKTEFLLIGSHHKLNNLDSEPSVNIGHNIGVEIDEIYFGTNTLKM
ncbi:Hypothetical predicted protein [Paramuricea clavata]|uniref:Reverse transcriptase domain-containing protein n=1 Tax=Paramuricea clavata TaxID=317549 RepID=A0A7D9HZF8_PARCT|nr:Hypothetical predicted protein [Paramuricea clavata]